MSKKLYKRSLYDSVWEIAKEIEDIELVDMGMNESDVADFYEEGLMAFRRDDIVFIINNIDVLAIYTEEEFAALLKKRELFGCLKEQPINEFLYAKVRALVS